ncbi:hypothetical protein OG711_21750 [Streptomyces uncialis]|uniref:hypothetical protein n=1 Tax=Streptomyces uncialis TaxID=1048205 RepID=UPI002E338A73|nr:hypothetical protein [Streptomyces uncialis]
MFELAPGNVRIALNAADAAKARVAELEGKVNRAKHPDEILTDSVLALGSGPLHCDLAPAIAAERWDGVRKAYEDCEELSERWHTLEGEAESVRVNAVRKGAEAIRAGKKAPSVAAAILDAETQLESCSLVLTDAVADLRKARSAYDALWRDQKFLAPYRDSVIAAFKEQRAKAAEAYSIIAGAVSETRRRYGTLHDLTVNHLDAIPEEPYSYLPIRSTGWAQADLENALGVLGRQVSATDPLLSGDFLTLPLEEIADAAEEVADNIKGTADRQNYMVPRDGIISTRLI